MLLLQNQPHLLKIKDKHGQVIGFEPNKVQRQVNAEILDQIATKGKARIIAIKGRQQGVTTNLQLLALSYVMTVPAFNAYTQAHDASIANNIFEDKIKFAFDNLHPAIKRVYKAKRDNTRQLMFEGELNSSNITVGLSARGTTQNFLHISEAGKMSQNKKLWDEMIQGSLPAAENAEVIVIESTADGGLGPFYDMVQAALTGENEFTVLFLKWTDSDEYQETPPDNPAWMDKYRTIALRNSLPTDPMLSHGLSEAQFYWYYRKAATLGGDIKAQYPLDLQQAFSQNVEGSYYQDQIDQMSEDGRFEDNPEWNHNPNKLVNTYWDLAVSHDLNAVIMVQSDGPWINIIDYYENTGVGAATIANDLFSKGYLYDKHYAPHDVDTRQMAETGLRTKKDIYRAVGINFNTLGRTSVASGVEAVRLLFSRIRIAKNDNTTLFVNRLRAYRSEDRLGTGLNKEVHDINSHAADSLRYLAVSIGLNQKTIGNIENSNPNIYKRIKPLE